MKKLGLIVSLLCLTLQLFAGPFGFVEIGEKFIFSGDYTSIDDIDLELGGYKKYSFQFVEPVNLYFRNCYVVVDAEDTFVYIYASVEEYDSGAFNLLLEGFEARYGKPRLLATIDDKGFLDGFMAFFQDNSINEAEWTFHDGLVIRLQEKLGELNIEYSSQQYCDYLQYELPPLKRQYELLQQQLATEEASRRKLEQETARQNTINSLEL